jgi:hypothetical protein
MFDSSGLSGPPCGTPSSVLTTTPSGITTFAFSIFPISPSNSRSSTRLASRAINRWWFTRSKNFSRSISTTQWFPKAMYSCALATA